MNGERITVDGARAVLHHFEVEIRAARAAALAERARPAPLRSSARVREIRRSGLDFAYLRRMMLGRVKEG